MGNIALNENLSDEFILEFKDRINWKHIGNQSIKEQFIIEHWKEFSVMQKKIFIELKEVTETFIEKYIDEINKSLNSVYLSHFLNKLILIKTLTPNFIEKYHEQLSLNDMMIHQKMPESVIEKYVQRMSSIDWYNLSSTQKLSENFIRTHQSRLFWNSVCKKQKMSEEFIVEMRNKVNWVEIFNHQNISFGFIKKHITKLSKFEISRINSKSLNLNDEQNKEIIKLLKMKNLFNKSK